MLRIGLRQLLGVAALVLVLLAAVSTGVFLLAAVAVIALALIFA